MERLTLNLVCECNGTLELEKLTGFVGTTIGIFLHEWSHRGTIALSLLPAPLEM